MGDFYPHQCSFCERIIVKYVKIQIIETPLEIPIMRQANVLKWIVILYLVTLVVLVYRVHEDSFDVSGIVNKVRRELSANSSEEREKLLIENRTVPAKNADKESEYRRYGPGENGTEVLTKGINISLPGLEERNKIHGFNTFISDIVSIHRILPDMRPTACKKKIYPENLPPISVVIIFRDEWWSILLRTVYSVLEHSPAHLIHEIILVDDGSTDKDLLTRVRIHVSNVDKLKLVRNEKPLGLMIARQTGVNAVEADLFVVMDGHMEVSPGWLEPLIYRLIQRPKALLCSHVGGILQQTFKFSIDNNRPDHYDHFDKLFPFFDHVNLDQMFGEYRSDFRGKRNHGSEPLPYGTIQGMMMVMRKDFFQQLGGFDPGMRVWGSEQIELSVKVWMCGGVVEMIPCSVVAHMYRITPWGKTDPTNDFHSLNKARMSRVWMDPPYSDTLQHFLRDKNYTAGDLTGRHEIRRRNRCKPYQYFIDKIREISNVFIPTVVLFRGQIKSILNNNCVDIAENDKQLSIILYTCHPMVAPNQYFILTNSSQIRGIKGNLFTAEKGQNEVKLVLKQALSELSDYRTEWTYDGKTIKHLSTDTCLTAVTRDTVGLQNCTGFLDQSWEWESVVH